MLRSNDRGTCRSGLLPLKANAVTHESGLLWQDFEAPPIEQDQACLYVTRVASQTSAPWRERRSKSYSDIFVKLVG